MTTGHVLPGYGDPVSRLRRVKSAGYPLDITRLLRSSAHNSRIDPREFDKIRNEARQIWSRQDREPTTYNCFYHMSPKVSAPCQKITLPRPSSPTRLNKPHPPPVFLTNRLHYIEGYQNPDTTVGKDCYKVDGSLSTHEYGKRRSIRDKYNASPSTALVSTFMEKFDGLKECLDPEEAQAAEAWLKIAYDKDKDKVFNALQYEREKTVCLDHFQTPGRPKTAYPSLYRWMKNAGPRENDKITRIMNNVDRIPVLYPDEVQPYNTIAINHELMRQQDIAASMTFRSPRNMRRGDFMIHPGWPPSIPHHYVP